MFCADIESEDDDDASTPSTPVGRSNRPLTARQAVLASGTAATHVSLGV